MAVSKPRPPMLGAKRRSPPGRAVRRGFSLVELMAATAITASLSGAGVVLLRTSYALWRQHEAEMTVRMEVLDALRHFVRNARQGRPVGQLSAASDSSLTLLVPAATANVPPLLAKTWRHDAVAQSLTYEDADGVETLARNVVDVSFSYVTRDAVATFDPALARGVAAEVVYRRPQQGSFVQETARMNAWFRIW